MICLCTQNVSTTGPGLDSRKHLVTVGTGRLLNEQLLGRPLKWGDTSC